MGALTRARFRARLQNILGNRGFDSELDDWLQMGMSQVVGYVEFEEQKVCAIANTVIGQYAYQSPPRLLGVLSVRDHTNERFLRKIDFSNFYRLQLRDGMNAANGQPRYWTRRKGAIMIWPRPAGVYELEIAYLEDPEPLIEDDQTTRFPATWDWPILCFAAHTAFAELGEESRADVWLKRAISSTRSRMTDEELGAGAENVGFGVARRESELYDIQDVPLDL